MRLLENHFSGNAHQIAELPDRFRLPGQSDDTAGLPAHGQRQIDAGFDAGERACGGLVDFDRASVGKGKLSARMEFADASRFAAANDDAAPVHDVNVERNDLHGPFNDFLRQSCLDGHHACLVQAKLLDVWALAHK